MTIHVILKNVITKERPEAKVISQKSVKIIYRANQSLYWNIKCQLKGSPISKEKVYLVRISLRLCASGNMVLNSLCFEFRLCDTRRPRKRNQHTYTLPS